MGEARAPVVADEAPHVPPGLLLWMSPAAGEGRDPPRSGWNTSNARAVEIEVQHERRRESGARFTCRPALMNDRAIISSRRETTSHPIVQSTKDL